MTLYEQDATEKRRYQVTITGDTVSSATATISPTGPTLGTVDTTTTTATVMVSSLSLGTRYTLTLHVVGASGQEYTKSTVINCVAQ